MLQYLEMFNPHDFSFYIIIVGDVLHCGGKNHSFQCSICNLRLTTSIADLEKLCQIFQIHLDFQIQGFISAWSMMSSFTQREHLLAEKVTCGYPQLWELQRIHTNGERGVEVYKFFLYLF